MLNLPSSLFTRVCTFVPPTSLFASRRVSNQWKNQINNSWKEVVSKQFPEAFDMVLDHESFLLDVHNQSKPSGTDLQFRLVLKDESQIFQIINWTGNERLSSDETGPNKYFKAEASLINVIQQIETKTLLATVYIAYEKKHVFVCKFKAWNGDSDMECVDFDAASRDDTFSDMFILSLYPSSMGMKIKFYLWDHDYSKIFYNTWKFRGELLRLKQSDI